MDRYYEIVNKCLHLLKHSGVSTVRSLKLEIQLIQIKRLLLNYSESGVLKDVTTWEHTFEELFDKINIYCNNETFYTELIDHISVLITKLVQLSGGSGVNINLLKDCCN